MEIATLALAAYTLAKPFLDKTQEGIAKKVGEDIWNLIKKPFTKKGNNKVEELAQTKPEEFTTELQKELQNDPQLVQSLLTLVSEGQKLIGSNNQQNINTYGEIQKQVNIQTVNGDINL